MNAEQIVRDTVKQLEVRRDESYRAWRAEKNYLMKQYLSGQFDAYADAINTLLALEYGVKIPPP